MNNCNLHNPLRLILLVEGDEVVTTYRDCEGYAVLNSVPFLPNFSKKCPKAPRAEHFTEKNEFLSSVRMNYYASLILQHVLSLHRSEIS
jgi:hypothetical protein